MSSEILERVSSLIKDELSLEKIRDVKEQLIKEKSASEYELQKESQKYYKSVEDGLKLLNLSQKSVKDIKNGLDDVDKLSKKSKSAISRYDVIFEATKLYETIDVTSSIYDKIVRFGNLISQLDQMLEYELSQDALESGCPYLLHIHYRLTMARDFQDQMTVMADISTSDVQSTIRKLFAQVSSVVSKFDRLLESLIYDIVELVRGEQISLVIRLFKVIDLEEREDLRIAAVRNIIKKKELAAEKSYMKKLPSEKNSARFHHGASDTKEYPSSQGLYEEILSGTVSTRTTVRGYKNFFLNKLKQSVQDMFIELRKEYDGDKKFGVLNNLDWVFNELMVVKEHVTQHCPEHWHIFDLYFETYYEEMHALITELVESEPETLVILDILAYDKQFQKTLVEDFGFPKKEKRSVIGDGEREQLFNDYLSLIVVKMSEWIGNLENSEFEAFYERKTPPHVDSEGLLYLDGTRTCFQMFTQQVEVAAGSGQAKILVGVIDRFCGLLKQRQKKWMNCLDVEVKKLINFNRKFDLDPESVTPDEACPGGLVEYIVAVANDQMKAADYSVAISTKYGQMVTKNYERTITEEIERILDGFAEVAKYCSTQLIMIMFEDLRRPFDEVFSKSWYSGNQAQQTADTLYEYLIEIKTQMNVLVYSSLLESVVEETILRFIGSLRYGHSFKQKNNKFLDCMKRDFEIFYRLLVQLVPETEDKTIIIDDKFKIMEYFMDFSCGPTDAIVETWVNCLQVYWDTPLLMLSAILNCRKDVDNSTSKRILQAATEISNDPQRLTELRDAEVQPTFISRLNLNS
ncbi:SNARE-binding exocyst subunit S6 [Zygosaccharomyces mellis]|uniref:SNARE-binding exocyst subunit S6 n=1 Tax=Zygosaccharomyces mellis TaxID=42258 RepID=A0A4C2E8D1_9SACH|nr:SNARE-binding exocyst subunit S6 [Zygosaccharomyces mellis]